jgi:hypothetical protein
MDVRVYTNRNCTIPKSVQDAMRRKHRSLLRYGEILLLVNTRMYKADSKLIVKAQLGNRPPPHKLDLAPRILSVSYLEKALVRTLFHL